MKKLALFVLLLNYLATVTPVGELLKIPALIKHYTEHKQENNIDFLHFMTDHYLSGDQKDGDVLAKDDEKKNKELPFKNIAFNTTGLIYNLSDFGTILITSPDPAETGNTTIYYNTVFHTSSYLSRIWQPPRLS